MKWGYASDHSWFVILPESVIDQIASLYSVNDCATWGEVADQGDEIMTLVLGLAGCGGHGGGEVRTGCV